MRRLLLIVVPALLLVFAAPAGGHHRPGGGGEDVAVGSVDHLSQHDTYVFEARSDPLGGNATGYFEWWQHGRLVLRGDVTCLNVVPYLIHPDLDVPGATAHMSGVLTFVENPIFGLTAGEGFSVAVAENYSTSADMVGAVFPLSAPPATCPAPGAPPTLMVERDQFVVVDATCDSVKDKNDGELKCKMKKTHEGGGGSQHE